MRKSSNGNIFCATGLLFREIHLNSSKDQWCRALMFSLIYTWTNNWVNNETAVIWDVIGVIMMSLYIMSTLKMWSSISALIMYSKCLKKPDFSKVLWCHQMETFSALLALCAGNSLVTSEFPSQRPVTQSFDAFFDPRLNKRLSKQHEAGDLRCQCTHYDVTVMLTSYIYCEWHLQGEKSGKNQFYVQYW